MAKPKHSPLATPHSPLYSKYQEWVEAGKPYWVGVSLFNQLNVLPQLRGLLNKRENPYNVKKLDSELKARLSRVPGTPADKRPKGATPATPKVEPAPLATRHSPLATPAEDATLGKLGPDVPKAYTDPKLKAIPFATLPALLQKARIEAIAKVKQRTVLHDQLAGEFTLVKDAQGQVIGRKWSRKPLEGTDAEQAARTIVELSDAISAHFDAETHWVETGALPETPMTLLEELAKLDDGQLERRLNNQSRPAVSRWKKKVKEADGEKLVEAQMRLGLAEQEVNAIKAIILEREQKRNADVEALRAAQKPKAEAKRERDRIAKAKRDAAKRAARKS
jgi:hypothetical protein